MPYNKRWRRRRRRRRRRREGLLSAAEHVGAKFSQELD